MSNKDVEIVGNRDDEDMVHSRKIWLIGKSQSGPIYVNLYRQLRPQLTRIINRHRATVSTTCKRHKPFHEFSLKVGGRTFPKLWESVESELTLRRVDGYRANWRTGHSSVVYQELCTELYLHNLVFSRYSITIILYSTVGPYTRFFSTVFVFRHIAEPLSCTQ